MVENAAAHRDRTGTSAKVSARRPTKQEQLAISYSPIAALAPNSQNPRNHSKKQVRQIADSIATFGFVIPIVIDDKDTVVAGHGRLLAARQLGIAEVPVIRLHHLSDAQVRAFAIADNRLTENATWNDRLLAEAFKALSILDLDFRLEVTGFDMGEIDLRIEGLEGERPEEDPSDAVPSAHTAAPVTRTGDLWLLDEHRLFCGNALEASSYTVLQANESAAAVFTDPPYNVPIDGNVSGKGKVRHREFQMAAGEMTAAEFTAFLGQTFSLLARHSADGALHFICMDWRHLSEVLAAGEQVYSELKNVCVWVKHNAGMGSLYRSQHELVLVFKRGSGRHQNNVALGKHGRNRTNVWSYPGANTFGRSSNENPLALHPTVKPVALIADAIIDSTGRGDIVLDPFVGSGTTIVAADRTGRRCHSIEIDPLYVDVAIRRWQKLTGGIARHAVTGWRFSDVEAEAGERNGL